MKRRKSSFEKWFSFSRHRRRFGAGALGTALEHEDLQALKKQVVAVAGAQERVYAHGSAPDLAEHLLRLRTEFVGQPELLYRHAQLIVLVRREVDVRANCERFERLWLAETPFLCSQDPVLRAMCLGAVALVNTVKLQETERLLLGQNALAAPDRPEALETLRTQRVNLFDGLSAFIPGTDDTLRNMRWRLDDVCALHPLGAVVLEIFDRLQQPGNDNVYLRFRQRHTREKTGWWKS